MEHTLAIDSGRSASAAARRPASAASELLEAVIERVPPPDGDPERRAAGDGVRLALRRVPRRGHLRPRHERHGPQRAANQIPAGRHHARSDRARPVHAAARGPRRAFGRPGRLHHLQHQVAGQRPHRRHGDRRRRRAGRRRCPATKSPSGWSSAACIRPTARTSSSSATRSTSSRSTTPASSSSPKPATPWASAFAAASSACCTWKSCSSGSKQDADIDLVQTAPNVTYEIIDRERRERCEVHTPQKVPDQGEIEEFRQPIVRVNFVLPTEYIGPIMKLCTDRRGELRAAPSTSRRRGRCSSTTCRWPT